MKDKKIHLRAWLLSVFVLLFWQLVAAVAAATKAAEDRIQKADALFMDGHFAEAEEIYRAVLQEDPANFQAALSVGKICLFKNSLEESEAWLKKAIELNKEDQSALSFLAENYYRRDEFKKAAELFEAVGQKPKADKLRRLAEKLGEQTATYAGGRQAKTYQGIVDKVEVGDFIVKNVPVHINDSPKGMSRIFGQDISGVIGTVFLYHFLFTLDYPGGNLVLERLTEDNSANLSRAAQSEGFIQIPFWMAGDHFMVAWGTINEKPILFFIDTGMAGGGFTCTESMLKEAGIQLPEQGGTGIGGGGQVSVKVIQADLTLGAARENNVRGFYGALPPGPETRHGFRLGGLISHGFLRPYRVIFDFKSMTLYLERTQK
jgi:predicted aspartyl protease